MRLFLDTEFSHDNLLKAELVSLALVSEDGATPEPAVRAMGVCIGHDLPSLPALSTSR